jgi:hypothetical protein
MRARERCDGVGQTGDPQRIAGRHHEALLATGESDDDGVVQPGTCGDAVDIGPIIVTLAVQVDGGGGYLVALEPVQPRLRALGQQGEAGARLPCRPFEQRDRGCRR